ncbi:hypothetical protein [Pseudonocardia spinosispora]|uniref:hypothetical protein n=1 Tax=Pseudonocardia spinosispora TaxID=103441 RepID=UPI00040D111C|nr:hypothetical protein [Pseudonocardia spinosispora]
MPPSISQVRNRGLAGAAALVIAALVTIFVILAARATWLGRAEVDFAPSAFVLVLVWGVSGVLVARWLRQDAAARALGIALWASIGVALVVGLAYLGFMDFGRPTYRERSFGDVMLFVIVESVLSIAAALLGLVRYTVTMRGLRTR